ncbi:MAG: FG-GAP-like repeat-containing protein [Planctomycetota bacterium]
MTPRRLAGWIALLVALTVAACGDGEPVLPAASDVERLAPADRLEFATHLEQGLEHARRFEAARALAELERCRTLCPGHPEVEFHRARLLLRTGPAAEARAVLEELARREPPFLLARRLLAERFAAPGELHDPAAAEELRRSLRETYGGLEDLERRLAEWLVGSTGPSPVAELARDPAGSPLAAADPLLARLARAYSRRFDMGTPAVSWEADRNRFQEADRLVGEIVAAHPGLAAICAEHGMWLLRSQVRLDLGRRPDRPPMSSLVVLEIAQQYFERTLDASALDSPLGRYGLLALGLAVRDMGDFAGAIRLHEVLLAQPDLEPGLAHDARFSLGFVHLRRGEQAAARPLFEACAAVRPGVFVDWMRSLAQGIRLPRRVEPVTEEHRRTLGFAERARELGVNKLDGAGPSAWCDVDRDGDLDLFVSGCDTYSILYRNDGDRFTDVSRAAGLVDVPSGFGATFADYDNDGDGDLYIGRNGWTGPAPNLLFRNRGDGTFEDVTEAAGLGDPGSSFVEAWADLDRDGFLDLLVSNGVTNDGSTNRLYHNEGDGTFTDATARCGLAEEPGTQTIGLAVGDYDLDGWPDVFANSWRTRNRLYHNRGDGTFEEVAAAAGVDGKDHPWSGYVAFLADLDGDLWPDLLLTKLSPFPHVLQAMLYGYRPTRQTFAYATKLYRNEGDGTFVDRSLEAGLLYPHGTMGANVGDLDNDGDLDFYLGTGDPSMTRLEPNAFYVNEGGGRFVDLTRFTGLGHLGKGHGITLADFDMDGDLDVYAPQGGFVHGDLWENAFYVNELGNRNHWLAVGLTGVKSNRMGVGARLVLRAGDVAIHREVTAGGAFGSSSTPFVHFGLGRREAIDRLEIRWPSGEEAAYTGLPADSYVWIAEGAAEASRVPPAAGGG